MEKARVMMTEKSSPISNAWFARYKCFGDKLIIMEKLTAKA